MNAVPAVLVALRGFAGVACGVTILALAWLLFALAALWRLRQDYQVLDAAERLQAVDLTALVKTYVPPERQSHRLSEELPIVKAALGAKWPRWRRMAVIAGVVTLVTAASAAFLIDRNIQVHTEPLAAAPAELAQGAPATKETEKVAPTPVGTRPAVNLDVLQVIQGVWGARFDFLQSCSENPQTITVSPDRTKLSVHYAKPIWDGAQAAADFQFVVVSAQPDALVVALSDAPSLGNAVVRQMKIQFADANTYEVRTTKATVLGTGAVVRCP